MKCFNCERSDFIDNEVVCLAFGIGPVKINSKIPCQGVQFRSVYNITLRDLGFDVNAYYPSHPDRVVIRKNKFLDSSLLEKDI
ncbi:MAG: hypothetical protein QXU40_03885, partial [Candidatus Pacearchaeota archaeon]